MTQPTATKLSVLLSIEGTKITIGTLKWSRSDRLAAFEFTPTAIEQELDISPFRVKLRPGIIMAPRLPFDGLHGVFADSLPDGWGRLLVDRQIAATGRNPSLMTPLDRLAIVGARGMGALVYEPEEIIASTAHNGPARLDWFADQAQKILQGSQDSELLPLLEASGGSAGARPKIMALRDPETGHFYVDDGKENSKVRREHWLVKLKLRNDRSDVGKIEYAYAKMAKAAGIDFPDTAVITDRRGIAHFAVKRFDRTSAGRIHIHTLAGLVHADFRVPSLDYADFLKVTKILSADQNQVEEAFRRMVFNVLSGNRDDHAKNHAFLMDKSGKWRLSPAYDLTPSDGPGGEHNMTISGEGREPGPEHITKIADDAGIPRKTAMSITQHVAEAISSWREYADRSGLNAAETSAIANRIESHAKKAWLSGFPCGTNIIHDTAQHT